MLGSLSLAPGLAVAGVTTSVSLAAAMGGVQTLPPAAPVHPAAITMTVTAPPPPSPVVTLAATDPPTTAPVVQAEPPPPPPPTVAAPTSAPVVHAAPPPPPPAVVAPAPTPVPAPASKCPTGYWWWAGGNRCIYWPASWGPTPDPSWSNWTPPPTQQSGGGGEHTKSGG